MAKTMTPTELATELSTDARTVRKFLRAITPRDAQPGKGSRWAVPANATELRKLNTRFAAWGAEQAALAAQRAAAKVETAAQAVDEEIAELDAATDDDSLDALEGPSDEEIKSITDDEVEA